VGGGDRMGEFSFCCKDNASADGFGRLRDAVGDEDFGGGLVEDVGECGPGLPETALEAEFSVIGLVGIGAMGSWSMSNIASEGA
jgi:hypothetical protein